jgi:hypothetical protein
MSGFHFIYNVFQSKALPSDTALHCGKAVWNILPGMLKIFRRGK